MAAAAHETGGLSTAVHVLERCLVDSTVVLLWIGLWTPFAAIIATAIQIATISLAQRIDPLLAVAAALRLSLAMLGPGAWTLDARLFGRKLIV